jgi:uncharacterized protein YfaS (alpha-2-macroglobulin family)
MSRGFFTPVLRRRNVLIAVAGTLVIAVGAGVGVYLNSRAHPPVQQVVVRKATAPTPVAVGSQSTPAPQQAVLLAVVSTSPADGTFGVALKTPISILFNLSVKASALGSLLSVQSGYDRYSVPGTISQGKKPQEVVFKPASGFDNGAAVSVTLGHGVTSLDGATLDNDYSFNFTTVAAPGSVTFMNADGGPARLVNAPSGRSLTLGIQSGSEVPLHIAIKTYRASAKDLLAALVYTSSKDGFNGYVGAAINTSSMRLIDNGGTTLTASGARTTTVQSGVDVTISQPDGIYLIVAADAHGQYGSVWVDFSRYGILLRQDDQKVVIAGEDLLSSTADPTFNVTFYNLLNGVHPKLSGNFSGAAEFASKYPAGLDIAIATAGGEEIAVPMSSPESGALIRVGQDLSRQPQIFLTTDKPAYLKGETVRFAGVVRMSNDQVYTVGGGVKVALWTAVSGDVATTAITPDGTFSGSFRLPAAEFNSAGLDSQVTLFANSSSTSRYDFKALTTSTSIVAIAPNGATNVLKVTLDKSSYLAGDQVVASIAGLNGKSQPLSGQTVSVLMFATQHAVRPSEMDSFPNPSTWGDSIAAAVKVRLDSTGHATYSVTPKVGLKATDQEVTLVAIYGSGTTQAYAARTATFYQADEEAFLLAGRSDFQQGETVVAPFVVENRAGARVGGLQLAYQLDSTIYEGDKAIITVVASGTATTDGNGMGTVRATYKGSPATLTLRITGKDQSGRVFQDARDLNVFPAGNGTPRLDVTTDKIAYTVGDTANLTVTSPAATRVLLSLERGRVHQYRWVQLAKGDNALAFSVSPDLAPGFSVVFSYIQDGAYSTAELAVFINNSNRLLKVTVTADQPTYAKGQTAHLTVTVVDSAGAPVAASLLADGYEARMTSNLQEDQASIAAAFLTPNRLGTNASSSLLGLGLQQGGCGGGGPSNPGLASGMYPGRSNVWLIGLTTDATGHASINVPMSLPGPARLIVFANTATSSWGQAETVLNVP